MSEVKSPLTSVQFGLFSEKTMVDSSQGQPKAYTWHLPREASRDLEWSLSKTSSSCMASAHTLLVSSVQYAA